MAIATLQPRLADAAHYVCEKHFHFSQRRTDPAALAHPFALAALVLEHHGDENLAVAALLMDTFNTGSMWTEIGSKFGFRMGNIVSRYSYLKKLWMRHPKELELQCRRLERAGKDILIIYCAETLHAIQAIQSDYVTLELNVLRRRYPNLIDRLRIYWVEAEVFEYRLSSPLSTRISEALRHLWETVAARETDKTLYSVMLESILKEKSNVSHTMGRPRSVSKSEAARSSGHPQISGTPPRPSTGSGHVTQLRPQDEEPDWPDTPLPAEYN